MTWSNEIRFRHNLRENGKFADILQDAFQFLAAIDQDWKAAIKRKAPDQ